MRFGQTRRAATVLLLSTALVGIAATQKGFAQSVTEPRGYSIPAQPLSNALLEFADESGLQVFFDDRITAGLRAPSVNGPLSAQAALNQLLSGSNLQYRFTASGTVSIYAASDASIPDLPEGALLLDAITVTGGASDMVFSQPSATTYISGENIQRYRGRSPADMFRSTPSVYSGEARNGGGAIDPNIRGMQGMGRVQTTVDGAENSLLVYQGYQGTSNRSYVDPDFIEDIEIHKGADVSSFGNAGKIAMRTVSADDIVKPGNKTGFRVNMEVGGNTSDPVAGNTGGFKIRNQPGSVGTVTESENGMSRPSAFTPTSHSWSAIGAIKEDKFDVLLGYATRKSGNYHAGTNGPVGEPVSTGPREFCYFSNCFPGMDYVDYIENAGLSPYRGGEEVLNTQSETENWLFKSGLDLGYGRELTLNYTGFRSRNGDVMASRQSTSSSTPTQREQLTETDVDSVSLKYTWTPEGSDLIDLRASLYWTGLEQRNAPRGSGRDPESVGLPADFLPGTQTTMMGAEIANTSHLPLGQGDVTLDYGLTWRMEDTKPTPGTKEVEGWLDLRDARRNEVLGFVHGEWATNDWLTLTGGLRYQHYWSKDRNTDPLTYRGTHTYGVEMDNGGWGGSLGFVADVSENLQVYGDYSDTLRLPNVYESSSAFSFSVNPEVQPERSKNWEIGANYTGEDVFSPNDQVGLKFGYFNWHVDDYLARVVTVDPAAALPLWIEIDNIHAAKFAGFEMAATYQRGGFTADLSANYYTNVEFCRSASTCEDKSLYGDYATNQVPPEYSLNLAVSQTLMDDRLTLGGQINHVGARAIGHGDVTAAGASSFISLVEWDAYTLIDVFAEYKISDNIAARVRVENLTDKYYVDPLSLVTQPAPGRTVYAGITMEF
jgi:hemoglobin/transferrin/lactoferrin receptor protein